VHEEFILLGSDPMVLGIWCPDFPKEHSAFIVKGLEVWEGERRRRRRRRTRRRKTRLGPLDSWRLWLWFQTNHFMANITFPIKFEINYGMLQCVFSLTFPITPFLFKIWGWTDFKKCRSHLKIVGARLVTRSIEHP